MAAPTPAQRDAYRQQRHAETQHLLQRGNELIAAIRSGAEWRAWLDLAARFPGHGLRNALLIQDQNPQATQVADFDTWSARGRHVIRGQRGIRILQRTGSATAPASIFDISQTTGPPHPPPGSYTSAILPEAWSALIELAARHGHVLPIDPQVGTRAVHEASHQVAHLLLGTDSQACHGARRVEAESVAYLIDHHLSITDVPADFPDVTSWAGSDPRADRVGLVRAFTARIDETTARIRAHLTTRLPAPVPVPVPTLAPVPARRSAAKPDGGPMRKELEAVHRAAQRFYLAKAEHGWALRYLADRGLPPAIQRAWGIGWAPPGWTNLLDHLIAHGHQPELVETAGLARRSRRGTLIDTFRDRVMLPVRQPNGTIVAFIGRAAPNAPKTTPKYLNSPDTPLYTKGDLLVGLHETDPALRRGATPIIVEGALDAIAIDLATDQYAAVAPSGTALTQSQCRLLAEHAPHIGETGLAVALDGDPAGQRAAIKAYQRLKNVVPPGLITTITLPRDTDPSGILQDAGPERLAEALDTQQQPLARIVVDHHIDQWQHRLDTAEGQVAALRAATAVIVELPAEEIARQIPYLSHRLHVTQEEVRNALLSTARTGPQALATAEHPHPLPTLLTAPTPQTPRLPDETRQGSHTRTFHP